MSDGVAQVIDDSPNLCLEVLSALPFTCTLCDLHWQGLGQLGYGTFARVAQIRAL